MRNLATMGLGNDFRWGALGCFAMGRLQAAPRSGPCWEVRACSWLKIVLPRSTQGNRAVECRVWVPSNTTINHFSLVCSVGPAITTPSRHDFWACALVLKCRLQLASYEKKIKTEQEFFRKWGHFRFPPPLSDRGGRFVSRCAKYEEATAHAPQTAVWSGWKRRT